MGFNGQIDLQSCMDEEKSATFPNRISFGVQEHDSQLSSARTSCASARTCASATSYPLWPKSPETPWTRSPIHISPTSPLIYHCLASLHRHEGNIFSITVSKDFIFTSSESRRIHAWKQPDCSEMGYIKARTGQIRAILAYGRFLFTTHSDYKIRVWDVSLTENFQPKKKTTIPRRRSFLHPRKKTHQHKDYISCIAYNHAENIVYTGSWDKTVKAWKVSERLCIDSFVAHEGHVNAIVINQEDGCLFTCSSDGTVKIWRRVYWESSHNLTMTLRFQPSPVNALAFSSSSIGCFLYSGSSDGLINFWEKEKTSGRFNHRGFLQGHHFAVLCLQSINDLVISGSEDATMRIWRREEGSSFHSCLAVMDGHHGPIRCIAACIEKEDIISNLLIYSASLDQTFKVWRVKVYPAEKTNLGNTKQSDQQSETPVCLMNPVLSPSWVEKKMQGIHF